MDSNIIKNIVNNYGTPAYVYDGEKIKEQYAGLQAILPECFEVFYSMKANPLLGICELFNGLGSNIEVASSGELSTALEAGFSPNNIIFTSPGKTREELEYAVEEEIYSINIESIEEAILIDEIAKAKTKTVNIAIRVNPDFDVSGAGIKMSGVPTQFGIDYSDLPRAFEQIDKLHNIKVIGIHVYSGTQVLKAENIYNGMEAIIKMALEIAENYKFELKFLDLGGGFGIPYFKGDIELDRNELKAGLNNVFTTYKEKLRGVRLAVESGRFLMAEAGIFLTKVIYSKENKGQKYIICDGGSNFHGNSAFLGRYIRNNFPMYILGKKEEEVVTTVAGPLCTPTDVVAQKLALPKAELGDIVVIEKSGAYGLSNSPILFLSHPSPIEVIVFGTDTYVLRERGKNEDFIKGQNRLKKGILGHV